MKTYIATINNLYTKNSNCSEYSLCIVLYYIRLKPFNNTIKSLCLIPDHSRLFRALGSMFYKFSLYVLLMSHRQSLWFKDGQILDFIVLTCFLFHAFCVVLTLLKHLQQQFIQFWNKTSDHEPDKIHVKSCPKKF